MAGMCCVEGCDPTKEDVTYFKFPSSRTLRRKWLDAISGSLKVGVDTAVCSQHFLPHQYQMVRGKKRLKAKVVPSVFDKIAIPKSPEKDKTDSGTEDLPQIQTEKSVTIDNNDTEQNMDHRLEDRLEHEGSPINGDDNVKEDDIVKRRLPEMSVADLESNNDIEDIIAQYQIKQIRPLHKPTDGLTDNTDMSIEIEVPAPYGGEMDVGMFGEMGRNGETGSVIDLDDEAEPVFIEVSVEKAGEAGGAGSQDCLMLLESVQCDVDPTSLMFPHERQGDERRDDSDVIELEDKKEDPVSLLTSSDEDEVIIQEPKYEMIEVSDETDEDDVPLVKLFKPSRKNKSSNDSTLTKILWGKLYENFCMKCHYTSTSSAEHRKHLQTHSNGIHVCELCSFTTSSKHLYAKHKRKHTTDKQYKCHLCKYKAKHNMSLVYHLKFHDKVSEVQPVKEKSVYKCDKCGLVTDYKSSLLRHVRACSARRKRLRCGRCSYQTDRRSDLKRHTARRHNDDDD